MSIHDYEELAALHAIAKILVQPQELRDQLEQALKEMGAYSGDMAYSGDIIPIISLFFTGLPAFPRWVMWCG